MQGASASEVLSRIEEEERKKVLMQQSRSKEYGASVKRATQSQSGLAGSSTKSGGGEIGGQLYYDDGADGEGGYEG